MYRSAGGELCKAVCAAQLVEALRYKPESRVSIPDGVTGFFSLT